jgi:adenosylmethionine-8-amino-7-oxononanoate aminotransferase
LSITLAKESVYEAFLGRPGDTKTFYHGHSFTGNPLAAAVALESMRLLVEERMPALPGQVAAMAAMLERFRGKPWARNVRQCGMVGAFEVGKPDGESFEAEGLVGRQVAATALGHGVYLRPLGDTIYFMPPLCITHAEIADLGARVFASVEEVLASV